MYENGGIHWHVWEVRYVLTWLFDNFHEINYQVCKNCGTVGIVLP